MDQQQDME
jgi:hypothetical protein